MSQRILLKKLKSLSIIVSGGTLSFGGICIYHGNENFFKEIMMPSLHYLFSPEICQSLGIFAGKFGLIPSCKIKDGQLLKSTLLGLEFPNPIGIAAGLDKNAEAPAGLFRTGIGFIEVGTVTPKPQSGNLKPRIFGLSEDKALINRCGFNSKGHSYVKQRLEIKEKRGILGVNIGKNKESLSAAEDYVLGVKEFSNVADYLTVNVSSPNTPGLRSLQKKQALADLLDEVLKARENCAKKIPILLKISPDLSYEEKKDISDVVMRKGKKIDGLIISNTTLSRPDTLKNANKRETGGLSGKPLKDLSTQAIHDMYKLTKGQLVIVGVGGVSCGKDAYDKIKAGASLIQVYTAITFEGPPVIGKIKRELKELLSSDGYSTVGAAVGSDHL